MSSPHDNQAVGERILERAKSGEAEAVEWWRRFIHRVSGPGHGSPMDSGIIIKVAEVMLEDHREFIERNERLN
jgi:hypothetical protein